MALSFLIPVLVTGIQPAQVLGLERVFSPRRRASAGFL
ncbi:hypothetical protein L901_21520 [Agrobacterium sp. D14]|nr:hypothetical protein L901_21520 [Agrobacterium sp. D14]